MLDMNANHNRISVGICLILASLLATGCGSKADNRYQNAPGAATRGDWLCEAGKAADDWDCIQSEDIEPILKERAARKPQPLERPPTIPSLPDSDTAREMQQPLPVPGTALPQTPQPIVDPNASLPSPSPSPSPSLAPPPNSGRPQNQPAPITTATAARPQEPAYAQLAYRPKDPVRIIDLPENFYAAQLLAVSTKKQIEDFVVEQDLYNMSAARIEREGQILYVLLLGVYESKDIARSAVSQMPSAVQTLKPWVRPIEGLQQAMIRADRLAAMAGIQ